MPDDPLHFDTAEGITGAAPAGVVCAGCQTPITTSYYEAAGKPFCGTCTRTIEATVAASQFEKSSFIRATIFGFGGAVAGALVYFAVVALTGYEIGLIAILVGYMVGWTVHKGSGGRAGRSYQILALALTYFAVGVTYLSLAVKGMDRTVSPGMLALLALAMPVLAGLAHLPGSLISLLIVSFALRQAWHMNRAPVVKFTGPYHVGNPSAPEAAGGV